MYKTRFVFLILYSVAVFGFAVSSGAQSPCQGKTAGECIIIQSAERSLAEVEHPTYSEYLSNLYNFLLGSVGILSLGALVYGGVLYVSAAANPSKTSEAKRWMWNAIYGLLLAAFSFVILYTINPDLTKGFTLPCLNSYAGKPC
ncbi:MAG: hypothetical protein A2934_04010 [Candidatus Sungbacteria bacterium RIFCSPLOWO2_01_FULL_47_10]|uniref:Vitamin K epoxide reductase domain-containing protein n=1 Tax=Candidatus Sungbacteria bacterium RIFCSPLOWO2_01_FULL_47_10 TaxID=1802276 RepID=A0A1G2L592_9BACT|nr:MAG: hypothetical protein A2934_04010 [Candidatus Sungbacteria bacterium RIFCSPLOWO2_01_FULL_47_10]